MNTVFMSYYEHLAKLATIANKQTLFLAHLLYRMELEKDTGQYVVTLTAYDKRKILQEIGCESKNWAGLSSQYIALLSKAGLIKAIGCGAYLVNPECYGGYKYIKKELRAKSSRLYETRVFTESHDGVEQAYIITDEGERIDL